MENNEQENSPWPKHTKDDEEEYVKYEYAVESLEVPYGFKPEQGARLIEEELNGFGKLGWICYPPINITQAMAHSTGIDPTQMSQLLAIYMYRPRV